MTENLEDLEKAVKRAKRIASERAGELHDLVEDRLPAGYAELPGVAAATYDACEKWHLAQAALAAAEKAQQVNN
ncbi:MAG: hypothetical protein HQL49_01415 [Gammaproteobacteria bacterium]|nr:hypothetical protein [Gammaproteobacteria bacterium]